MNILVRHVHGSWTTVVEHGVVDPGHRYTGEFSSAAVVVNEPLRRFLADWDALLADVTDRPAAGVPAVAATKGRS